MLALTVSQLNRYVKAVLEEDSRLSDVYIKGEVSNFIHHRQSGHMYFTLKDGQSAVKAVMFRSNAGQLRFQPENGMAVLVQASVSLYERDGSYQIYVTDMQPDGAGALAVAFEQLKAKLAKLGYFSEACKKNLPAYPKVIGIVTSEAGAALQDVINVLSRRYPIAKLVICPAQVQGQEAPAALIRAIRKLDRSCDVIIVGRGGGSAEDLWCFNDEALAKVIFEAVTPVVSAVGHETDYTICDFVADLRAPTPSAAAELVTPSIEDLRRKLADRKQLLRRFANRTIEDHRESLEWFSNHKVLKNPLHIVEKKRERLDFLYDSLYNNKRILLERLERQISHKSALLDSLSPLKVLRRGYAVVLKNNHMLTTVRDMHVGDHVDIRFGDGDASANISQVILGQAFKGESGKT